MWVSAGEGIVRGGTLVLPSVRSHHAVRYACSQGTESSPRVIVRLVVFEPLTVTVTPNPLVSIFYNMLIMYVSYCFLGSAPQKFKTEPL